MALKNFFNRLKFWNRTLGQENSLSAECSSEYRLANRLKRYEKYVSELQCVVMWDKPTVSAFCVLSVNILFCLFVSLEWRFYGIVSSVLLAVTVHDAWTGHVWPEISVPQEPPPDTPPNPSVVAVSRMLTTASATVKHYAAWLRNLRLQQPGLFCCLSSLVCVSLLVLGRHVSGLLLVYSLLMGLLLGPGLYARCVPPQLKTTVAQYASCVNQAFSKYGSGESSDDEYLPVTTSEDLALLTRVSDLHHDTYDSITNPGSSSDMVSGLGQMPSHEEDSLGSTLSDLEPAVSQLPLDPGDDSDSNAGDHQIQFQSGHFNGDSSSDEEAFTKDLEFSEADERDGHSTALRGLSTLISQAVASNVLGSVGMLASAVMPRPRQRTNRRTDTDSDNEDFEIINRDELNQDFS